MKNIFLKQVPPPPNLSHPLPPSDRVTCSSNRHCVTIAVDVRRNGSFPKLLRCMESCWCAVEGSQTNYLQIIITVAQLSIFYKICMDRIIVNGRSCVRILSFSLVRYFFLSEVSCYKLVGQSFTSQCGA